jgi:hypothetical protein
MIWKKYMADLAKDSNAQKKNVQLLKMLPKNCLRL